VLGGRWYTPSPYWLGDLPAGIYPDGSERNSAAVRVRARRRIKMSLGVYPQGDTELAPLLQAAKKLEVK
jgi:hypothetical protein